MVFAAAAFAGAFADGVDVCCGVGDIAQAVYDVVAPLQESGRLVAGEAGRGGGGEVVFGALDGGAGLASAGVGGAQVLGVGQVVGQHGEQGVGGFAAVGGRDEEEFGVGGRGGVGEPVQLFGWEVVGVVDDDQCCPAVVSSAWCQFGAGVVDGGGGVGVAVGRGVVSGGFGGGQRQDAGVVVVGGVGEGGQGGGFVGAGVQVEQLEAVRAAGEGGDRAAVGVVEAAHGRVGRVVEGGGAGGC